MEIYKGTSAFAGIAIGKILYYHRGEYQIRQSMVDNVKKELDRLDHARTAVREQIQHMYKNGYPLPKEQELTLKRQLRLLGARQFSAGSGEHDHNREGQCSLCCPDYKG